MLIKTRNKKIKAISDKKGVLREFMKILVIEDEEAIADALIHML